MIYTDLNKKFGHLFQIIKKRYRSKEAIFILSLFVFFFLFVCSFLFITLFINNLSSDKENTEAIEKLGKENKTLLNKIKQLEEIDESGSTVQDEALENYKKELNGLIDDIKGAVKTNSFSNSITNDFKLDVLVDFDEFKSRIIIKDRYDNSIRGEKVVDGLLISSRYGDLYFEDTNYGIILFSMDPFIGDCTGNPDGSESEKVDACMKYYDGVVEDYREYGGLWMFDINKKEFKHLVKITDLIDY